MLESGVAVKHSHTTLFLLPHPSPRSIVLTLALIDGLRKAGDSHARLTRSNDSSCAVTANWRISESGGMNGG
jgi:hypothetical protein